MLESPIQNKRPSRRWWSREDLVLLILLGALFFLPGLGQVPLFDRDEPRFATAAREMLASGDYIVPHFNGQLRPDKPPLVYWLMTVSYRAVGGVNELGARLPAAMAGIFTLLVMYFMVGARFGRVTGLLAAIILGSCALFVVESRMATADAVMMFFIVTCMACAWQAWEAGNDLPGGGPAHLPQTDYLVDRSTGKRGNPLDYVPKTVARRMPFGLAILFWVSLAAGTLAKGVPLFFVLVPMILLSLATGTLPAQLGQWRSHLHVTGIRIGLALTVGVMAIALATRALRIPPLDDARWSIAILGALLVAMILTPGLPGVLLRCITGGNWRWWKRLRPLVGIPLLLALVGWWVVLAGRQTNWELINQMVGLHFLKRVAGPVLDLLHIQIADPARPGGSDAMASYSRPPGFYLVMVWVTFWPWSVLLLPSAYHAFRRVLGKTALAIDPRPYQFLLAWIVPMWIILELSRGKLLHYPLPLYVGMAILCADAVVQGWHRLTDVFAAPWFAATRWVILAIWLGLGAGVLVGAKLFLDPELFWRCVPLAGAMMAAGAAGAIAWNRPSWPFVTVLGWAAALLMAHTLLLPDMPAWFVGKQVGLEMADLKKADPSVHLAAQGFEQPTLVFYAGGNVEMPTITAAGRRVSMLEKIPWGPGPVPPGSRYMLAVNEGTLRAMEEGGLKFYVIHKIGGAAIEKGQRAAMNVFIVSNMPTRVEKSATRPATAP